MSLLVFFWWMRTRVTGATAFTNPSSTANGPTAEEMLPQLALTSTIGRSMETCPKW